MFDIGWIELGFVAVLALLVVGPKDLPKLLKAVGAIVSKSRKLYRQVLAGVNTLDREIQVSSGQVKRDSEAWRNYVPEPVRNLPEDFLPGSMTADQHAQRREAFVQVREVRGAVRTCEATSAIPATAESQSDPSHATQDMAKSERS